MEPRTVFWKKQYPIKGTDWIFRGYSRAAYRTGFYVHGLNVMFDCGPQSFKKPNHIFITHSHTDHIFSLPTTLIRGGDMDHIFNLYAPKESETFITKFVNSMFEMNSVEEINDIKWFDFHPQGGDMTFDVESNGNKLKVRSFDCDHSIPTVSYGISLLKNKLNPKYIGMPGKEIAALRKSGVDVSIEVADPKFAFVCDTSIEVLKTCPFILDYPIVFIECTFISEGEEQMAVDKKHIHWQELKPYVLANKNTKFVLIHFSLRYKDEEIKEILGKKFEADGITNVDLWLSDLAVCDDNTDLLQSNSA